MSMPNVVVLGSGMAGFGATHRLHAEGVAPMMYDKNSYHGGHTASFLVPSNFVDWIRSWGFEAESNGIDVEAVLQEAGADLHSARWQMAHFGHLAIYTEGVNSVVVSYSYGKGQVIWWAAATPLSNAGIRQTGNLNLFLNSVGPPGERRVLWDEYFHGRRGSLWTYFAGTPISWGMAQLGLFAVALLLTFARLGPSPSLSDISDEFVSSTITVECAAVAR